MEIVWKRVSTIVLLMLSGSFVDFDCWGIPLLNETYDDIQALNAACIETDSCESPFDVTIDYIQTINTTCNSSDSCKILFDLTYDDIQNINGTCEGSDSCESPRNNDSLNSYNCNCNRYCGLFGTCCVDSNHRHRYPKPLENLYCDSIFQNETSYYVPMIYDCNPDFLSNKTTVELCNSNAELSNNPVLKVPVTDLVTGISYKNYHCFSCNKNYGGQEPIPWKLELEGRSEKVNQSLENLRFDTSRWTWILDHDQTNATDVILNVSIPDTVISVIPYCYNFKVISDCASNWTDNSTRSKCLAYMALTRIPTDISDEVKILYYRNPHCAICNYQNIDNKECKGYNDNHSLSYLNIDESTKIYFYELFSLDEETIECGDNMVYDSNAKKCRRVYTPKKRVFMQGEC